MHKGEGVIEEPKAWTEGFMETEHGKREGECPQLLDLIPCDQDWLMRDAGGDREGKRLEASNEKKLELTLAPPGGDDWLVGEEKPEESTSVLPLRCLSKLPKLSDPNTFVGAKRVFSETVETKSEGYYQKQQQELGPFKMQHQSLERKALSAPDDGALAKSSNQIRTSSPVVGWPPVRSFRKNIASSSFKPSNEPQIEAQENKLRSNNSKGFFVKINMDGIPIGRKVDLNAFDSYEKLSSAVEELFCSLLIAQRDPTASGIGICGNEKMSFMGLLDGSGEYTLVYEDDEGDRMLVGDVPWDMFVSTAKRLRVLKSSELSSSLLELSSEKVPKC